MRSNAIAAAIASLSCCDEVLVVDSGSTDRTREIAERCGARVLVRDWDGYSNQKNFAASKARHEWILSVDADERLSVELANEIVTMEAFRGRRSGIDAASGILFRSLDPIILVGIRTAKFVFMTGAEDAGPVTSFTRHCRLTARSSGLPPTCFIFLIETGQTTLAGSIATPSSQLRRRVNRAGRGNILRLLFGPPLSFLKTFVVRAGFMDGWRGVLIAAAGARYVFLREFRILR